ncbi:hypothetical protein RhiJN_18094 [Ceratobasidium sp. AG-Ba]|nr:hypothetical protein RhiJN_18094 [Ceratobasidium sp. AG-Ba]
MSSFETTSTKRASSNTKSATRTTSDHSSQSSTQSLTESFSTQYSTSVPVQTATITDSVPTTSSTAIASTSGSTPVAAIVVVVIVILGLISSGITFFLCKRKRRKQRSAEEPYSVNHEPKRRESHLQPALPDVLPHSSKVDDGYDSDTKSPVHSIDSGLDLTSRAKPRSSRASSSIFIPDDTMTVASRSHFLRPLSLGEPIALKSMQLGAGQMPTLPESPLQPNTNMEQRTGPLPQTMSESSSSSEGDDDDKKSTHTFTLTRPDTPELAPPLPPIPAQLPPLPPVPPIRTSLFNGSSRRDSSNTLAPTRYDGPSRPQSMISVYSTRTQKDELDESSGSLSPDVAEVLTRLKKRISTPWSINSIATSRTERMSVTRASEEA